MDLFDILKIKEPDPKNKPGPGKKQCQNCKNYIGVRTKVCKCGFSFEKKITKKILPEEVVVFEHLRTDTKEVDKIEEIKQKLNNNEQALYFAPTSWRKLCYSIDSLLEREGRPGTIKLKEDKNFVIAKCIVTSEFTDAPNPRLGKLQKLIVKEIINDRV